MIKDIIDNDFQKARNDQNVELRSYLGVIIGEVQLIESRTGQTLTDKEMITLLKKFKKSATDMLNFGVHSATYELSVLDEYIPETMSVEDVTTFMLEGYADEIANADNVMRLIGKFKKLLDDKAEGGIIKDALLGIKQK